MSTYTKILYQVVLGSKNSVPFLTNENQDILYSYIGGILRNKKCHPYIVGGYGNHIHIIFSLHPSVALSGLIKDIKKASHEMMMKEKNTFRFFPGWQVGYGAFTYSSESKMVLVRYVKNQHQHHKKKTFKEELIKYYRENNIDFEEKYLLT